MTIETSGRAEPSRVLLAGIGVSHQVAGGVPGATQDVVDIRADAGDVADLPAGHDGLAVEVDARGAVAGEHVLERAGEVGLRAAEHVAHHGDVVAQLGRAERQVEHGTDVVLELAGDRAVDGPVAGVVRAHGQLVDDDAAIAGLHQLDGEDADDAQLGGDVDRHHLELGGPPLVQPRRGRDGLDADAVLLRRLADRVGDDLARRRAHHERGQLAREVDVLLRHDAHPLARRHRRLVGEDLQDLVRPVDLPHALAVVAAARGLQDDRPALRLAEGDGLGRVVAHRERGAGDAEVAQILAHVGLVLRVDQRQGAWPNGGELAELLQVLGGHVLVVERDGVAAVGEATEDIELAVVADDGVRDDLGRGHVRPLGQQPHVDPQRDRRLMHHAGELPAPRNAHSVAPRHGTQPNG